MTPGSESATYQEYIDTYLAQHWPRKVLTSGADGLAVAHAIGITTHMQPPRCVCICIFIVLYLYLYVFGACH